MVAATKAGNKAGNKAGKAIVRKHGPVHYSIETEHNGKRIHTELLNDKGTARVKKFTPSDDPRQNPVRTSEEIDLPDAKAAQEYQLKQLRKPDHGEYDFSGADGKQNCTTHACGALDAGGVPDVPAEGGAPTRQMRYLDKLIGPDK